MSKEDRIIELLQDRNPLSAREMTDKLYGKNKHQSIVFSKLQSMESKKIVRKDTSTYPYRWSLVNRDVPIQPGPSQVVFQKAQKQFDSSGLHEDEIKAKLEAWLKSEGWEAKIAWGKARGADITATKGAQKWIIEVKGRGSRYEMRVNYFLAILGEILQRMEDADAEYMIALPDLPQFRNLWNRLPELAKERTQISAVFVSEDGRVSYERLHSLDQGDDV